MDARKNRDDQIKELEETLSKETERSAELKLKLNESRDTASQLDISLAAAQGEMSTLQKELNGVKTDKEKLACQLADISGSAISSAQVLTSKNESLQKMASYL